MRIGPDAFSAAGQIRGQAEARSLLDLGSGLERRLHSLSSSNHSENAVAVWGRRYVFARVGRRGGVYASDPIRRISRARASELDLRGQVAVFTVMDRAVAVPSSIRLVHLSRRGGRRTCLVAAFPSIRDNAFYSPAVTRRFVYWVAHGTERPGVVLRRRIPSRGCAQRGRVQRLRRKNFLEGVAATGGRVFYMLEEDGFLAPSPPFDR